MKPLNLFLIVMLLLSTSMPSRMHADDIIVQENGTVQKKKILKTILAVGGAIIVFVAAGGAVIYMFKKRRAKTLESYRLVDDSEPCSVPYAISPSKESLNEQLIDIITRSTGRDENQDQLVQQAEALIQKGADVNTMCQYGVKPILIEVVQSNRPRMVKLLLKKGANPNKPMRGAKKTPLDWAYACSDTISPEIIRLLIEYGGERNCDLS